MVYFSDVSKVENALKRETEREREREREKRGIKREIGSEKVDLLEHYDEKRNVAVS